MDPVTIGRATFTPPNDGTYNRAVDTAVDTAGLDIKHVDDEAPNAITTTLAYQNILLVNDDSFRQLFKSTIDALQKELADSGIGFDQVCVLNIDPQVDFVDGSLGGTTSEAVQERKKALELASAVSWWARAKGALILGTRDHHPEGHVSFATTHEGAESFKPFNMPTSDANRDILARGEVDTQIVWPDHCVQESPGSSIHFSFDKTVCHHIEPKGMAEDRESYSCIRDVYGQEASRVDQILQHYRIQAVVVTSLCAGFCVGNSAMDLAENNYTVIVPEATTAGVFPGEVGKMNDAFCELAAGERRSDINNPATKAPVDLSRRRVGAGAQIKLKMLPKEAPNANSSSNYKLYYLLALVVLGSAVSYRHFKRSKPPEIRSPNLV
jgi:nicotinamidase-related amidase